MRLLRQLRPETTTRFYEDFGVEEIENVENITYNNYGEIEIPGIVGVFAEADPNTGLIEDVNRATGGGVNETSSIFGSPATPGEVPGDARSDTEVTNITRTPGPHPVDEICLYVDFNYDIVLAVVCSMHLVFGIVYCLFGYRCFKAVMFLTGFIFGFVIVYLVCASEALLPKFGNEGVALGAGLLFGLITMLVQYVGLFMMGCHSGLFVGVVSVVAVQTLAEVTIQSIWIIVGTLLGSGLIFALLNLQFQKVMTIFGTSLYGGAIIAAALDYFVEKFRATYWVWDHIRLEEDKEDLCWFSWLLLGVWPVMLVIGVGTQWGITAKGIIQHNGGIVPVPAKKGGRGSNMQRARTREERAEAKQRKYRYLYQVRTAHGDVISQNYIQGLQKRAALGALPGDTSTLNSEATHLTVLPPDQAHPATPLTLHLRDGPTGESHG
ncbi:unnamed protein product [Cyprideis torosa]|uniref:Transmembrane protein 198 n=1 Tax=Cyprideis torosa TaxID=163714 RepID=A0A7R8ZHN5_9CRUS|nr:unnamed protein product [Cyprideis torosa]CAG0882923.1 unnamed protein product [Cyprideis torosa]